jgi:hypothetical protein
MAPKLFGLRRGALNFLQEMSACAATPVNEALPQSLPLPLPQPDDREEVMKDLRASLASESPFSAAAAENAKKEAQRDELMKELHELIPPEVDDAARKETQEPEAANEIDYENYAKPFESERLLFDDTGVNRMFELMEPAGSIRRSKYASVSSMLFDASGAPVPAPVAAPVAAPADTLQHVTAAAEATVTVVNDRKMLRIANVLVPIEDLNNAIFEEQYDGSLRCIFKNYNGAELMIRGTSIEGLFSVLDKTETAIAEEQNDSLCLVISSVLLTIAAIMSVFLAVGFVQKQHAVYK